MHRAVGRSALRASEAAAAIEPEVEVEPMLISIELEPVHPPGWRQAEGKLEQGAGGIFQVAASWGGMTSQGCLNPLISARSLLL